MKKIILLLVLAVFLWKGYGKYGREDAASSDQQALSINTEKMRSEVSAAGAGVSNKQAFVCDGRTHCSQMKSCDEAKYFLQNCPGVKMDGNNDGVPCEKQWCTK